jgi:hypothetical protein
LADQIGISPTTLSIGRKKGRYSQSKNLDQLKLEHARLHGREVPDAAVQGGSKDTKGLAPRTRLELAKAEEKEIQVRQLKEELIDREKALRTFYEAVKMMREAFEQWPARVAAPGAAELGTNDPHKLETFLTKEVEAVLMGLTDTMKVKL